VINAQVLAIALIILVYIASFIKINCSGIASYLVATQRSAYVSFVNRLVYLLCRNSTAASRCLIVSKVEVIALSGCTAYRMTEYQMTAATSMLQNVAFSGCRNVQPHMI